MPTFATPEPITVSVDLAVGAVNLVASDRADTVVTVHPSDPSKSGDVKAADEARVDFHDGTLTVETSTRWRYLTMSSVDVTIELPTGSALQGSALGPLFAQGRLGTCTFTSRAGDIRIDEAGRLDLRATAGSVVVGHALSSAEIVVTAGGVRVRELDGDAVIKAPNGATEIGQSAGSLRVNGAHGAITLDRSLGETDVRCTHGNIRVEQGIGGRVQLETSYGSIEIGVPEGTAAWVDATSQHGTVRNLLQDAAGPDENDRTVEVLASTSYGDIVVRRPHT
jgi:Putative adhesin